MYAVIWSEKAKRNLNKLDQVRKKKVIDKVENDLAKDPYGRGDCLKGDLKGQWKFRFSEYRIIYKILQTKFIIEILDVGNRSNIYD